MDRSNILYFVLSFGRGIVACSFIVLSLSCSVAEPDVSRDGENTSQFSESDTVVALSCSPSQQWVSGAPQEDGFVYAVGSAAVRYEPLATAMRRAQENARVELSKQLMVSIGANLNISTVRRRTGSGVSDTTILRERVTSNAIQIDLPWLEIVERCIDRRENIVFALASLNRGKATEGLIQQITQLDEKIGSYTSISSAIAKTEQIRRLLPVLDLITKREKLANTLSYVSGYSLADASNTVAIERRINNLFNGLSIALKPGGLDAKSIEPYVVGYLADKGFRISPIGHADIVLDYQLQMRAVINQGIYFVYAKGEMEVMDSDGRLVNMFKVDAKGGSPVSISRARDQAVEQIGHQFGERVVEFLFAGL